MNGAKSQEAHYRRCIYAAAALFAAATTAVSAARWANFQYRTFDLAYYVQASWQLIRGRFDVSVEHVPLLGNHVEPIVILFAPLFALFQHPMLFVSVQNLAVATMGPVGFSIARRLGIGSRNAFFLALTLLSTPAAGYMALHEFHPETLTAPFLLLMLHARVAGWRGRYWLWFAAVLACKENMALLLAAYCAVHLVLERGRSFADLRNWHLWPLVTSVAWFIICTKVITPALNSGGIDYLALYSHLGDSAGSIVVNALHHPLRIIGTLWHASITGNLLGATLLPFLALPLLRPRWLVVASPVLLQHLLSWRSSEWTIYFHYAAPLLPIFWFAMVEVIARWSANRNWIWAGLGKAAPGCAVLACFAAQIWLGPAAAMASTASQWPAMKDNRDRKNAFLSSIPAKASVTAPLAYLSHLAAREKLYSLHYILKGLKTLSRATYDPPPPTDIVLLDYDDDATFDSGAGYYHPVMKTTDGRIIPSSEQLLHNFLKLASWSSVAENELSLLRRAPQTEFTSIDTLPVAKFGDGTELRRLEVTPSAVGITGRWQFRFDWNFAADRKLFPWLIVRFVPKGGGAPVYATRGLCAPEAIAGAYQETWMTDAPGHVADGEYTVEALFVDNAQRSWLRSKDQAIDSSVLALPISLGNFHAAGPERTFTPR